MSIQNSDLRSPEAGGYACNGTVTDFAGTFYITGEEDVQVILTTDQGTETVLTITTDYTVSTENRTKCSGIQPFMSSSLTTGHGQGNGQAGTTGALVALKRSCPSVLLSFCPSVLLSFCLSVPPDA